MKLRVVFGLIYKYIGGEKMNSLIERYPVLKQCEGEIEKAVECIINTYSAGGKVLLCGNGGSASDCDHIVGELMKGFMLYRHLSKADEKKFLDVLGENDLAESLQYAVPAISLPSQSAVLSAFSNDVNPDMVYAQLMYGYGTKADTAIGISTSGNSKNVVNAMKAARVKGMATIALCGNNRCKLDDICDLSIKVPETDTYKVQELHLPVYHYICASVEKRLFE